MSKVENETNSLTPQDKDVKSSQSKTQKKVTKSEGEVEADRSKTQKKAVDKDNDAVVDQDKKKPKQDKKKLKQDKKSVDDEKSSMPIEKTTETDVTDKKAETDKKTQTDKKADIAKPRTKKAVAAVDSKKVNTEETNKPVDIKKSSGPGNKKTTASDDKKTVTKKTTVKNISEDNKKANTSGLARKEVMAAVESVKNEMPKPRRAKATKAASIGDSQSHKENKPSNSPSSPREEGSNIIINYFQQICEDLRAIRNHLVPVAETKKGKKVNNENGSITSNKMKSDEETLEEVKPAKKTKKSVEKALENSDVAKKTLEKSEVAKKPVVKPEVAKKPVVKPEVAKKTLEKSEDIIEPITKKTKKSVEKADVTEEEIKENATPDVVLDDDFYLSKLKSKIDKDLIFTSKDARKIWITSVGRLPNDKWNEILENLSNKKMIVLVDNTEFRAKYKFAE